MPTVHQIDDLHERLLDERAPGQYFRGQCREYAGPLWPAAHRATFRSADCLTIDHAGRLRKSGSRFHLCTNLLNWESFRSEQEYKKFVKQQQLKDFVIRQTRNALGYPLCEAFCQQAGLGSGGLDVTTSLKIAFFFALHEFTPSGYQPKNTEEPSIIYRWRYDPVHWSLDSLNAYEFHSCPSVVPVQDILRLFRSCDTAEDCDRSLMEYRRAINWGLAFDLDAIRGQRPFDLIRLPRTLTETSRIMQQEAALLIPDAVTSEEFLRRHRVTSAQVLEEIRAGIFIEDLAQNRSCDRFYFDPRTCRHAEWLDSLRPDDVFPKQDVVFRILRGWVRSLVANPYGTLPIFAPMPDDMDYAEFINSLLDNAETRFFS